MLPPSRAFKWKLKKKEKSKISNIWNKMHGTSYDSHLKNDQTFCKIKNIYIFNYCMVKFSHVATLVELSNENLKKMKNQK